MAFRPFPRVIGPFRGPSSNHPLCGWYMIDHTDSGRLRAAGKVAARAAQGWHQVAGGTAGWRVSCQSACGVSWLHPRHSRSKIIPKNSRPASPVGCARYEGRTREWPKRYTALWHTTGGGRPYSPLAPALLRWPDIVHSRPSKFPPIRRPLCSVQCLSVLSITAPSR
jgi:hypothetical protein